MKDSQLEASSSFFSRLLVNLKVLLLLLTILVAAFALQWPPLGIQLQSPLTLPQNNPPEPTGREFNHNRIPALPTNSADGQLHLPNGKHYMLDFHDVDLTVLESTDGEASVIQAINNSGMTFLGSRSHLFPGGGLTSVFLLSESHLSFHTWPEHSFVAIDIYTCGNSMAADRLVRSMYDMLKPRTAEVSYIERGSNLSHSVRVDHVTSTKETKGTALSSQAGQNAHPVLLNTQRPDPLVLPTTVDICVNAASDGEECILLRNAILLYSQRSDVQLVEVVDRQYGDRCLLLDGITQFCNSPDNELYTRSLTERVMQPLISPPHARTGDVDIYVIGGGDGWVGTHLLNAYPSLIRSIYVIDIDPLVSKVTQEFFATVSGPDSFKDSRVQYIAEDAAMWLRNALDQSADAVIIDCTDHTVSSYPGRVFFYIHLDMALCRRWNRPVFFTLIRSIPTS